MWRCVGAQKGRQTKLASNTINAIGLGRNLVEYQIALLLVLHGSAVVATLANVAIVVIVLGKNPVECLIGLPAGVPGSAFVALPFHF